MFFGYLSWVGATSVGGYCVFKLAPDWYPAYYWCAHFGGVVLGFAVLCEICARVLHPYPGLKRLSLVILAIIFVVLIFKTLLNQFRVSNAWASATTLEVARHFRVAQAILLAVLICILYYYRVPLQQGVRGVFLGYGGYVGVSVIGLSLRTYGGAYLHPFWQLAQQITYVSVVAIWLASLWSPATAVEPGQIDDEPYTAVYSRTARLLSAMRSSVLWHNR